jgi:hypothetical protein
MKSTFEFSIMCEKEIKKHTTTSYTSCTVIHGNYVFVLDSRSLILMHPSRGHAVLDDAVSLVDVENMLTHDETD